MAMAQAASGKRRSFYADLDRLRSHFDSLDQDRTGYIGYSELQQLVQKMSGIEEAVLPELMEKLDRDKDGKVSFDDFQALFEVEHESMKKRIKITASEITASDSPNVKHDVVSPTSPPSSTTRRRLPEIPLPDTVVLRSKPGRSNRDFGYFSPIGTGRPPSIDFAEQGPGQMQYLLTGFDVTDAAASPQLKRNSKVLSFFNDSEDVLEGIGDGARPDNTSEIPSPPMSPTCSHDEVAHVESLLESVINTREIDEAAVAKLCAHLKADSQEQEELISLLHFLDKKNAGCVTVEEFARGLQSCKNSAQVASSTPFKSPEPIPTTLHRRHTISTTSVPRLSEPFSSPLHTPIRHGGSTPLSSTPLHQPAVYSNMILSVLDPDKSGYVRVDSLVERIQELGVESEHNSSLEEALAEAVMVDQSGRVSVNEFTTSLEGALLTEGKSNNFLRQIALKTFHSEIHSLRSQVQQVSMERDTLQHSLNRTMEDKQKLVLMGEEQVDMVTKNTDKKLKDQEDDLLQRLKESEKSRREEQLQIEDRYTAVFENLQQHMDKLKSEEERLRVDLKLAQDENDQVIRELDNAHKELSKKESIISMLTRDLESRSDYDLTDDEHQHSRMSELENELTMRVTLTNELQEKLREVQDRFDLITADNEKMKQKYLTAKRDLQRRRNKHSRKTSTERPLSGFGKPQRPKRPLSGSHFGRSSPIKPRIFGSPLDLAIGSEKDHPVLLEDMDESPSSDSEPIIFSLAPIAMVGEVVEEEIGQAEGGQDEGSEEDPVPSQTPTTEEESPGEEDTFSRSSASLMEEIHKHEQKSLLENKIQQLEDERCTLQKQYQQLEQQLREVEEEDRMEILRELERTKQKQGELDRLISTLDKQSKQLSMTRIDIDSRLQVAGQSLANQLQGLRSSLTDNSGASATGNLGDLINELDTIRSKLEEERKSHDVDIANLKTELSKKEEESYSHIDLSLKLEEEKAQAEATLVSLQYTLESERSAHEAEVNILMRKLDNAEESLSKLERKERENMMQLREELEQTRDEIARYQLQTEKLQKELADADEKLGAMETSPPLSPTEPPPQTQEEQMALSTDEIAALLQQLAKSETEIDLLQSSNEEHISLTTKLRTELEECSQQAQEKLTEQLGYFQQQMASLRKDFESQLDQSSNALEASHTQEIDLNNRLSLTLEQLENTQTEVRELSAKEATHLQNIQLLEQSGSSQQQEITQLQAALSEYRSEITQLRQMESIQKQITPELSTQPKRPSSGGEDETDFIPALVTSGKLSQSSEKDSHDQIIDEMKDQLEEVQLRKKGLLDQLAEKNKTLTELQQKALEEREAVQSSALATTNEIIRFISNFSSSSKDSLSDYKERVEEVSAKLARVRQLLQERDSQNLSTLDGMMSDLNHSREESDAVKLDMENMKQRLVSKHEEEIRSLRDDLDKTRKREEQARARSEEAELELVVKQKQFQEKEDQIESQAKTIQELELQRLPVDEHVEAVQYVEVQLLEGVNEALLLNTNQDSRETLTIQGQVTTRPEADTEVSNQEQMVQALQEAEQKLDAFRQIQKTLQLQHQQAMQEIETKYEAELLVTNEVIEEHTADLRQLYVSVVEAERERAVHLTHSQLVGELGKEIDTLKSELSTEQAIVGEMEATLTRRTAEHEQVEAQIQTEHDEEVQALHQQKQQLVRQLEDTKLRYTQSIKEQDQHTNVLIQDLCNAKSELEKQLHQKSEESLLVYQKVAELTDEKRVLVDIIEHLCVEAGQLIDIV